MYISFEVVQGYHVISHLAGILYFYWFITQGADWTSLQKTLHSQVFVTQNYATYSTCDSSIQQPMGLYDLQII